MKSTFIREIFRGLDLNQGEVDSIASTIIELAVGKGRIILNGGQLASCLYFVGAGCLRTYAVDKGGREYTLEFAMNEWSLTDYSSLSMDEDVTLKVECLQDAILYQLPREELDLLCSRIPKIEKFYSQRLQQALLTSQKRFLYSMMQSASERYMMFIKMYPGINKIVKNYHIASYLGITPESLSRVIKDLYEH